MAARIKALLIVESPSKAKKISGYVGSGIKVMASIGHIRDLPNFVMGVNVGENFAPTYVIPQDKKKVVADLRKAAEKVSTVYLASDPDREGESIAWHLYEVLKSVPGERQYYRVRYNEVTKPAVLKALAEPTAIDQDLVDAQQARRIEDRLSGFKISKVISGVVNGAKSAGRVQSVALRLIVDRERAVQAFQTTPYWLIHAELEKYQCAFSARLAQVDGVVPRFMAFDKEVKGISSQEQAEAYMADLKGRDVRVSEVAKKMLSRRPQAPFITSTLQQAAATYLGYSPDQTMRLAQGLYENGYITYMRTDGFTVSSTVRASVEAEITRLFGKECVPATPNFYGNKVKNAQEAHEPIRPTDVTQSVLTDVDPQQAKLYDLIWKRFVASQMASAKLERTTLSFEPTTPPPTQHQYRLTASTQKVVFKGFLNVWSFARNEVTEDGDEVANLPALNKGDVVTCNRWVCERKETQPPARYNEASLVRALEENGIGRPSTYAATVQTLVARKYVTSNRNHVLTPTDTGIAATDYLLAEMPDFVNVEFTAQMEDALDKVADGSLNWVDKVRDFYGKLTDWLASDNENIGPLLKMMGEVKTWKDPILNKSGKVAWDDKKFVDEMNETLARGEKLSKTQYMTLVKVAIVYRDQLPGLEALIGPLPEVVDKEEVEALFAALEGLELNGWETKFTASLKQQFAQKGNLSPKQLALLRRMAKPEEDTERPDNEAPARELLAAFTHVTAWKEPAKRGRRVYDDQEFVQSLNEQLTNKHFLSEKQFEALKRVVRSYKEQIPDYAAIAEKFGIKTPAPRTAKRPATKRKTAKK